MINPGLAFHPWEYLQDELKERKWSQSMFAEIIGISRYEVNDIIKGRRNVTPRISSRMWEALGIGWETLLKLQNMYDLFLLRKNKEEVEQLEQIKTKVRELELV